MIQKAIFITIVFCFCSPVFAQHNAPETKTTIDASRDILTKSIEEAVKNAIKDIETENARKQEVNARELSVKLVSAMDDWFSGMEGRTKELNKLQHHHWSELKKFPLPFPRDYYLKSFTYTLKKATSR